MQTQSLRDQGYLIYKPRLECAESDFQSLLSEFKSLEPDEHAHRSSNRYRRYGNGVLLPWKKDIKAEWLPEARDNQGRPLSGYDQGGNNPEHQAVRYFPSLSHQVKTNVFLNNLIADDFRRTFWSDRDKSLPIYVGVHFVKLSCEGKGDIGLSSPDCFHQDGEPFTFAHLFSRTKNTDGGVNYIGQVSARNQTLRMVSDEDVIASFQLTGFMDSFVVHDPKVSHYVSPIAKIDGDSGVAERCMILIDFSPMVQRV